MTLRNAFGAIALDSTLLDARDRLVEIRNKLPTLTSAGRLPVDTTSTVQRAAEQAKVYLAGSGRLTLGVSGHVRGLVLNPAAQTTNVHILRVAGMGTATSWAQLYTNPSTGLPVSAARRVNNLIVGYPGDATELKVDSSSDTPLGGGQEMGVTLGIAPNSRFQVDFNVPLVLPPGASLGLNIPFTGAADAAFSIYWFRTPA